MKQAQIVIKTFKINIVMQSFLSNDGAGPLSDHKAPQREMRTAQYITAPELPAIQDLYTRRCQRKGLKNRLQPPQS